MVVDTFRYYAGAPERLLGRHDPRRRRRRRSRSASRSASSALITPWNFPLTIAAWKIGAGAGRRQRRGPQARRADAADRAALRGARAGGRPARGRRQRRRRPGQRRAGSGSSSIPTWRRSPSPARPRSAGRSPPAPRRRSSASRWSSAASGPTSSSPTPTSRRRRRPRRGRVRQRRPGLLRALADPRRAQRARRVPAALADAVDGVARRRPARRAHDQMGPLISAAHREEVASFVDDGAPRRDPRRGARRPGLLVPADRPLPGRRGRSRGARGDLRAGRLRHPVRRRGRGDPAGQRHDLRPVGLDLDAATARGRCAWRARSRPACCRSTRTPRCACPRRSAASSSPASAASWPHALEHYSEVKTVYYATEG